MSNADDYYLKSSLFCVRVLCPFQQDFAERIFYFMEQKDLFETVVSQQIGNYKFNNPALLQQAFTRRSYTEENGGQNNEVLEFIGDKALDIAVVRYLAKKYGNEPIRKRSPWEVRYYSDYTKPYIMEEFTCELDEGQLTRLKQKLVQKDTLAQRIDDLGFAEYLLMGKGDIHKRRNNEKSVKEDLFEAIIGAVTLDCNWNMDIIQDVVEVLLCPDSYLDNDDEVDYVSLIYEWASNETDEVPLFKYINESFGFFVSTYQTNNNKYIYQKDGIKGNLDWIKFHCHLKILDNLPVFVGYGKSKNDARKAVCKVAYEYLKEKGMLCTIRDEIDNPSIEMAINQLETLARRGYFSIPEYEFEEIHDEDGNPVWHVKCFIHEIDYYFEADSSSKKQAKKEAALDMLNYVLENYEE